MFSEKTLHRLVISLTVRVLILSTVYANPAEPMMYKLRRGSDLEIRHLIQIESCNNISELKSMIVDVMKSTTYPIEQSDNLKVDLYYNSVFDPKFCLARMTRPASKNKAKIQLFMTSLKRCLENLHEKEKMHMALQKKRAS